LWLIYLYSWLSVLLVVYAVLALLTNKRVLRDPTGSKRLNTVVLIFFLGFGALGVAAPIPGTVLGAPLTWDVECPLLPIFRFAGCPELPDLRPPGTPLRRGSLHPGNNLFMTGSRRSSLPNTSVGYKAETDPFETLNGEPTMSDLWRGPDVCIIQQHHSGWIECSANRLPGYGQ